MFKSNILIVLAIYCLAINAQTLINQPTSKTVINTESPVHEQVKQVLQNVATTQENVEVNPIPYTTGSDTPNTTTAFPTTSTSTTKPTPTPPQNTTTVAPITTSTAPNTTVAPITTSTLAPNSTTVSPVSPNVTTSVPPTTPMPPKPNQRFDFPSFIGGVMLTLGLLAIGFVAHKFYKARTDRNYHTL